MQGGGYGSDERALVSKPNVTTRAGTLLAAAEAVVAMLSVQLGGALSAPLLEKLGPTTTTWLRLTSAAGLLCFAARPRLKGHARSSLGAVTMLGLASAAMTLCYFEAIARIPMGVATTIEFLGPLVVALAASNRWRDRALGLAAGAGVLLLVRSDELSTRGDALGYAFAAGAGVAWAGYIVLTKRVGSEFEGLRGLSLSMMIAAFASTPFGVAQGLTLVSWRDLLPILGIALLVPLLPYILELLALRRLGAGAFGVLMSLEPAISACLGYSILEQRLSAEQWIGILLTVSASAGVMMTPASSTEARSSGAG